MRKRIGLIVGLVAAVAPFVPAPAALAAPGSTPSAGGFAASGRAAGSDAATRARVSEAYGRRPLAFQANRGQADSRVKFISRGSGYTLLLGPTDAILQLNRTSAGSELVGAPSAWDVPQYRTAVVRTSVLGADENVEATGSGRLAGDANYLVGDDPAAWHVDVPSYAAVRYDDIYRGVDLLYHSSGQHELEYDFVVRRGADPEVIRLGIEGADGLELDAAGNLLLHTAGGEVVWRAPVAYQEIAGTRRRVAARYVIGTRDEIGFRIGAYDREKALIIDPVLAYSTYLGGRGLDRGHGIDVDASGSAYVTGLACSTDFPTSNPLQPALAGATACDAFVTKFSPDGGSLVYSTYLGGSHASDQGLGIAVDASGSAHVAGQACSSDFPAVDPVQGTHAGGCDAFVAKLSSSGSSLVYSTYLGGSGQEAANDLAVDGSGNAYATGFTFSTNFPTVNAFQASSGGGSFGPRDAFLAKLSPAGNTLEFSTYLGGRNDEAANGVAVDGSGSAYVTGSTFSDNFPTANALQGQKAGTSDAFLTKFTPGGGALAYSTYLGGNCSSGGSGIAVDGSGSALVTGSTCSTDFPIADAVQPSKAGGNDAFVTKFSSSGGSLVHSTYLGGASTEFGRGVALDAGGGAHVTGWTFSTDFPTVDAVQGSNAGPYDVFVAKLASGGGSLAYSTYIGGRGDDLRATGGNGIAVDGSGSAYVTGTTFSTDFPTANALQAAKAGSDDAFVFKLEEDRPPVADAGPDQTVDEGAAVTLDGSASTDADGDPLSFRWEQTSGPAATLSDSAAAAPRFTAPSVSSAGATLTFRLVVDDGAHTSEPDTVTITVRDTNRPPACGPAGASAAILWPPDHGFVEVTVIGAIDPDGDPTTTAINSVTQDEPVNAPGEWNLAPDALLGAGSDEVNLRAERTGTGDGRIYAISFTVTDDQGASCTGGAKVAVPRDRSGAPAVDSAPPSYNSLAP